MLNFTLGIISGITVTTAFAVVLLVSERKKLHELQQKYDHLQSSAVTAGMVLQTEDGYYENLKESGTNEIHINQHPAEMVRTNCKRS